MLAQKDVAIRRFHRTENSQICPECGTHMEIMDSRHEGASLFIWYACTRIGCDGQWLRTVSSCSSGMEKVI